MADIFIQMLNLNPFTEEEGQTVKVLAPIVKSPEPEPTNDICPCSIECEYLEKAFFHEDGEGYKNDKSSLLFAKQLNSDVITFELIKNGVKVADLADNTYGTYYNGFDEKPLYVGYIVEWSKVNDLHSWGEYQIRANLNIIGLEQVIDSRVFKLQRYSDLLANGTVRIESWQTGNILGSPFDYTDLLPDGWYQSFRIYGKFGNKTPVVEIDNYQLSNRKILQIQESTEPEFLLRSEYLPASVANQIFYQDVMANKILINDYNILNTEIFRNIDVVRSDSEDVNVSKTRIRHSVKLKLRTQDNTKTN